MKMEGRRPGRPVGSGTGKYSLGGQYVPKPTLKSPKSEVLPNRHALATFLKGDPVQRTINQYSEIAPTGSTGPARYDDIVALGDVYRK